MENKTVPVSLEENRDKVIIRTSIIGNSDQYIACRF